MKLSLKTKALSLIVAVLLVVGMSPLAYAARSTAKIKLEKVNVKLAVGEKVWVMVDYEEIEEEDNVDLSRARVFVDKSDIVEADFASDGSDLTMLELVGIADGETAVWVKVGRFYTSCNVIVGRGNKSPAQIKKEEDAKKAEADAIAKDKSELGTVLDEAIKKATKKDVSITTTNVKTPTIAPITLKALAAKGSQAKKRVTVRIDSLGSDGKLQAQMFVDPAGLTLLRSDFKTGIAVDASRKASLGANYIASVKCEHTGSFNTFVEIAARVGSIKNPDNISIYNVDSNGKLKIIEEPSCSVDKNGLLHFYTRVGGEIVIMNGRQATKTAETPKDEVVEREGKVTEE